MTQRKAALLTLALAVIFTACSEFRVKTIIDNDKKISKLKKSGILLRLNDQSLIAHQEFHANLSNWLAGFKPIIDLVILGEQNDAVHHYTRHEERFFQLSTRRNVMETVSKSYLPYKSLGIINLFIRNNAAELKKIMADSSLDSIVIYEVYALVSTEMQNFDFDSVMVIVDRDLNLLYVDHQSDTYDSVETDKAKMKEELLNKVSNRLIARLRRLGFLERIKL
ncbi:MAG TPA: hypothetical protein PLE73_00455 [Spirochaetota bacterium]|nr:hypothetical protein [Spirochaetota bacterium]